MEITPQLSTGGVIKYRLGTLKLRNGYPIDATVGKIFDDIDSQRASKAYLTRALVWKPARFTTDNRSGID